MNTEHFFGREVEFNALEDFAGGTKAGFTCVRGRRRVGKSWLLREFQERHKGFCFYFTGAADESAEKAQKRFIAEWCTATKQNSLREIHPDYINWGRLFGEITRLASQRKKTTLLLFDEVQWLAKGMSGFAGALKEAWLDWEKIRTIKVVVCGSSNKFFHAQSHGDEKVLRGLKTRASIWVEPFTLSEAKKYFLHPWSLEEICLTYMMLGGIPYYLSQIDKNQGFIHAINSALFLQKSIFEDEVDEILSLEFNNRGIKTVKSILSVLGQDGTTQDLIQKKTGLSASSVSETLDKLIDYGLVFAKIAAHTRPTRHGAGVRYFMKDFFLNFYFQILSPLKQRISENTKGLLFPHACLASKKGWYIPNFSGKAFELLVRSVLESPFLFKRALLFDKMQLRDHDYEVTTYWDKTTEVDLIVEHAHDRISRLIECKWVSGPVDLDSLVTEALSKNYTPPPGFTKKHFLCLSQNTTSALREKALSRGVSIIGLEELVG